MSELKPCPFCGREAEIIRQYFAFITNPSRYSVQCQLCGIFLDRRAESETAAIAAWNTRPLEAALEARIAELEAENATFLSALATYIMPFDEFDADCQDCPPEVAQLGKRAVLSDPNVLEAVRQFVLNDNGLLYPKPATERGELVDVRRGGTCELCGKMIHEGDEYRADCDKSDEPAREDGE